MFNKINELLENKLYIEARREIAEMNPVDIAALIEEFPKGVPDFAKDDGCGRIFLSPH